MISSISWKGADTGTIIGLMTVEDINQLLLQVYHDCIVVHPFNSHHTNITFLPRVQLKPLSDLSGYALARF